MPNAAYTVMTTFTIEEFYAANDLARAIHELRQLPGTDAATEALLWDAAEKADDQAATIEASMRAAQTFPLACDSSCSAHGCRRGHCYY
jgi:hypothetical protein